MSFDSSLASVVAIIKMSVAHKLNASQTEHCCGPLMCDSSNTTVLYKLHDMEIFVHFMSDTISK